jgi:putative peptidoglycan lipid II flippase
MDQVVARRHGHTEMSGIRSVMRISLLTPAGLVLGFASNWFIVRVFGLSSTLDAFFVAYLLPTFAGGVIADFLGRNFIPTLDRLKNERTAGEVESFISSVVSLAILASIGAMVLIWLVVEPVVSTIAPGLPPTQLELAANMARIMVGALTFMSVNVFHEYLHQIHRRYFRTQLVKLMVPLATLTAVIGFGHRFGVIVLAWAFLVAHGLILISLLPGLGYRYRLSMGFVDPEVRATIVSSGWLILSGTLARARGFLERYLASLLGPGAVSALALAARISGPLQQGAALGLKVVAFRNASALVAAGRIEEAGQQSRQVVAVIIMLLAPISLWLAVDADLLVALLFSARHLEPGGLDMLTDATRGLLLATPLMAVGPILSNLYFVLNRPMVVVIAAPITLVSYAFFIFLFYEPWGVLGIALATFSIFMIAFVTMTWHLSRLLKGFDLSTLWPGVMRQCLLAMVCAWGARQLVKAFALPDIVTLGMDGSIVLFAYVGVLLILRDESLNLILKKLWRRNAV